MLRTLNEFHSVGLNCGWLYWILLHCCISMMHGFNMDTIHPLVYEDPLRSVNQRPSYFGYSVQFFFDTPNGRGNGTRWILVGAPRANSTYAGHKNIMEPGRVYRCSLGNIPQDRCEQLTIERQAEDYSYQPSLFYKDRKDYGWLGGSIAVADPSNGLLAVCSHRWANKINAGHYLMNGACYWSDHSVATALDFNKSIPLVDRELQSQGTYNFAYGQAGMALHMIKEANVMEEMVIGAPGVYNWTGTIIRVGRFPSVFIDVAQSRRSAPGSRSRSVYAFGKARVFNVTQLPQFQPNGYFGYSVSCGDFFDERKLLYASGAPRAAKLRGKVYVLQAQSGTEIPQVRAELEGSQLGEYFGASVLGLKVNGEAGGDLLLVGAPMYTSRPHTPIHSGDEGKVYVYRNSKGILEEQQTVYGSGAPSARFGSSIARMGDINYDFYDDVVIGAPYEDGKGAVYLYLGGPSGLIFHPATIYWQRIAASELAHPLNALSGFGISLNSADIDDNDYPDLAIGSYMSSHVIILRSQPIIRFDLNLSASVDRIDPNGGSLLITSCASPTSPTLLPPQICVGYTLEADVNYQPYPRLRFIEEDNKDSSRSVISYTETHWNKRPTQCRHFKLNVVVTSANRDFSREATFRLTAQLLKNPPSGSPSRHCLPLDAHPPGSNYVLVTNTARKS